MHVFKDIFVSLTRTHLKLIFEEEMKKGLILTVYNISAC